MPPQTESDERARITLGSMIDLNLNGRLLDDVGTVLKGWLAIDKRRCSTCRRRLRTIIGDGTVPIRARIKNPSDPLTQCDECWDAAHPATKTGP
jgi:uncharacterized protein with PIN domain